MRHLHGRLMREVRSPRQSRIDLSNQLRKLPKAASNGCVANNAF
jgi:hypothetical protein